MCLRYLLALFLLPPCAARAAEPIRYQLDLTAPESHLIKVRMDIPGAQPGTEIQFPAWNCLYQIRDFVKNVSDLKGECDGQPVDLAREDLNTWKGPTRPCRDLTFHYWAFANTEGPFDSVLNADHSFLNLGMVLFYLPAERQRAVQIRCQLPPGWKLATLLEGEGREFQAANYDALVDSPIEAGHFEEYTYTQDFSPPGARAGEVKHAAIRIIIDANPADYSSSHITNAFQRITEQEASLMQDLPFQRYTFILHFPRASSSTGGMEHLNGTSIAIAASDNRGGQASLETVAAHELFHAWNVKRIRPQSLEPVDYLHGNDTRDLWFCEGVTNTYSELVLLRAGLIDRATFYDRMAAAIQLLQNRSARKFQSAETSGREAWLEKYPEYNRADRSVSYYNKGELLGYLLDLGMRHASQNRAGLDDLLRRLNQDFARQGRFYTLRDLSAIVTQLAPGFDISQFLADDVRGTAELEYSQYLEYAGLHLSTQTTSLAAPGFTVTRNAGGLPQVDFVEDGSDAQRAGMQSGDVLMMADGDLLPVSGDTGLPTWRPGQAVKLQIARGSGTQTLKFHVGANKETSLQIKEAPHASIEQLRVREGWLTGVTN